MKKTSMWCLVVLLSLGSADRLLAQGTRSAEEGVDRMEEQLRWAQQSCNPDLLSPLLADKVVITGSKPKVTNNAQALATCKTIKWDKLQLLMRI